MAYPGFHQRGQFCLSFCPFLAFPLQIDFLVGHWKLFENWSVFWWSYDRNLVAYCFVYYFFICFSLSWQFLYVERVIYNFDDQIIYNLLCYFCVLSRHYSYLGGKGTVDGVPQIYALPVCPQFYWVLLVILFCLWHFSLSITIKGRDFFYPVTGVAVSY